MADKVADKKYTYTGPLSGVTLPDGRDVILAPGKVVTLPEESPFVKRLVTLKRLTEVVETQEPAAPAKQPKVDLKKEDSPNAS